VTLSFLPNAIHMHELATGNQPPNGSNVNIEGVTIGNCEYFSCLL